ncbi:MFS transporter [Paenibacillus mesophilus]|uniref:MFS transporter n=1 Tax=Paenibacillus mesophilus TaxID=2582849 RepID=UPI001EE4867E|nr:MFS transporter [Paenibacillus mesophilus]
MKRLLWMGCLCYVLTGFTLVIVGSVLPELLAHYSKGYGDGGKLVLIQFIGLLGGVLSMPFMIRLVGRRWTVGIGLVGMSVETLFIVSPPWGMTMPLLFVAGFGAGLVEASIGSLILLAAKERPAAAMSKLEITFGAGALAMPFLVSWLIVKDSWLLAFPVLGLSALLLAVVWGFLSFGELDRTLVRGALTAEVHTDSRNTDKGEGSRSKSHKGENKYIFVLCALFFFLYGGSEVSIIHFLPSVFMEDRFAGASAASLVVSVYWIGMVVGRTATGLLADRFGYYRFLLVSAGGAVVVLGGLAAGGGLQTGFVLAFLVGLFMSGMFAIALIYANMQMPGRTDRTTSLLMAVNGSGGALLPYLSGWTMETFPAQATVWLLAGCMGLMLLFLILVRQAGLFAGIRKWYDGRGKWKGIS